MPGLHEMHAHVPAMDKQERTPNRLILCFDGTGNEFAGNSSDTNIVKLYNMFNRDHPHQMHYYQPGIGTYTGDGSSVNQSWWGRTKSSLASTIDEGVATTFDSHVIAGYRFLMRYYGRGDPIYIFGFSRGAFTARFLARMVSQVGLLSMGNEELVPFAYRTYQNYELGQPHKHSAEQRKRYIDSFKSTFCRHEHPEGEAHSDDEAGIKVHFLGLFDTVNSVGTLEVPFSNTVPLPEVHGTAEHVRHAVAIDERRVKFKPALLQQDLDKMKSQEDIKEVWFPGNHGDIGGGWPAETPEQIEERQTFWGRIEAAWRSWKNPYASDTVNDAFQLSDIALKWMVDELDQLPGRFNGNGDQVEWHANQKNSFMERFYEKRNMAIQSPLHDTMVFGGGSALGKVIFWNFMEFLPFIKRWEYRKEKGKYQWCYDTFPLNMGGTRDIPPGATLHYSVLDRMNQVGEYRPTNDVNVTRTIPSDTEVTTKPLKHVHLDKAVDEALKPYQPVYPAQSWWHSLLVSLRLRNPPEPLARVYWHEKRGKGLPSPDNGQHWMTDTTYTLSLDPPTGEEEPEQMPVVKRPKLTDGYGSSNGRSSSHEHSSNHTYTTSSTTYKVSSGQGSRTRHEYSSNHQAEEGRSFV